jgi:ferrochelatase
VSKLAVVLFNLGGPDGPGAVGPFLENLFKDRAIIDLPALARIPLAKFIAARRAKMARANYAIMGGGSPLLPETLKQARALEVSLNEAEPSRETRVFVAMRYWKPFAEQTAKDVAAFAPDEVVLLPLYPQFSTTTTGSSVNDWAQAYKGPGRTHTVCCYPTEPGLTDAHAKLIRQTWEQAGSPTNVRLLFSAHGLPEKVIEAGDPYQAQIQATAQAVAMRLPELTDWNVCYQSRVGRLKWIGPSTDDEIRRAGAEGKGVLICPIAFVSEHVETLVELDHEYAELAGQVGCAPYLRAPTPSTDPAFIRALTRATNQALARNTEIAPHGAWRCPEAYGKCACRNEARGAAA